MPCELPILKMPGAKVCASVLLSFAVISQLTLLSVLISLIYAVAALVPPAALSKSGSRPPKSLRHR